MNTQLAKYLLGFFFFLFVTILNAQKTRPAQNSREACHALTNEAIEDINNKKYAVALEKLLKAEAVASENLWYDQLWLIKNNIGNIYTNVSSYGEALEYYEVSYSITQKIDSLEKKGGTPLTNIAVLFAKQKNYKEALPYMQKAYDIFIKAGVKNDEKKNTANNLAGIYNELGDAKKSLEILNEVKDPVGNIKIDFLWEAIYIKALLVDGQTDKAQYMAEKLYKKLESGPEPYHGKECYTCLSTVLYRIYAQQNKPEKAIEYAKLVLLHSDELTDKVEFYEEISNLYLQMKDLQSAFIYKDSALISTNELSAKINRNLFEINKVKLKISDYQNELSARKKQHKTERTLFIVLAVSGLIVLFLTYKILQNRAQKQKQKALISSLELEKEKKEHLLAEKQLKTTRLSQQHLKHEIAEKNRELTSKAIYLSKRNELIQNIINSFENDSKLSENKDTVRQIKIIKKFLKADDHENDFMRHFEKVNPTFLKHLKENHPKLTANDIRFLCYVYMNLSLKEISTILNITYDTCRKRRKRIINKMNLGEINSLYNYLMKI